jgi:diaminopimelate decarboxylase
MSNYSWYNTLNLKELSNQFGSPLWIVNENKLKENISCLERFTGGNQRILYPVKANPAPIIMEIVSSMGCGADCSNLTEVNLALFSGVKWKNIAYNSPFQDFKTARIVLENGGTVVCDDLNFIQQLESSQFDFSGNLWLRINPLIKEDYRKAVRNLELMSHGQESSKFGIPEENVSDILQNTRLKINGLHVHVGTQMDNIEAFVKAIESLHRVADIAILNGHNIEHIDIGGGLGISFNDDDRFPELNQWVDALLSFKKDCFSYYVEPGHSLVGNAVGLLTTVKTIKESRGRKWAVCDVGTDQLAKITLLHWPHKVLTSTGKYLPFEGDDALAGPLCFAGDNLLERTNLEGIEIEETLLITHVGAYTFALSNSFNGRRIPAWIKVGNDIQLTTEAESTYSRIYLQHHYWRTTTNTSIEPVSETLLESLLSPYLHTGIQNDNYKIVDFGTITDNVYEAQVEFYSDEDFISMPTAIRVIGNLTIAAFLLKQKLRVKDRPVIGQKVQIEYFGHLAIGRHKISIHLSEAITNKKNQKTIIANFNVDDGICIGGFLIKAP